MAKFKIIITDNETGKEVFNEDFVALIGGAAKDENGNVMEISFVHSRAKEILGAVECAEKAIDRILNHDKKLSLLYELIHEMRKDGEDMKNE